MIALFKENRMFRVFLGYQLFSGLGGVIFSVFMLLSVHLIYQNPIYTGIAGFLIAVPFIFSFAVGPVIDKSRKPVIVRWTTLLEFAAIGLLAFTPLHEQIGILFLFAIIFIAATAAAFESPAGKALLPQIVQGEQIVKANSIIQITQMLGGIAIAGLLFISLRDGADSNFSFIYGVSAVFLAVAFMFALFLKEPINKETSEKPKAQSYFSDLKAGAKFLSRNTLLFITLAYISMALVGEIAAVNRPMFFEYYAGAQGYIVFGIMAMIGGIVASILMGVLGEKFKVGRLVFVLMLVAGAIRFAFVQVLPLSYVGALIILIFYATFASSVDIIFSSLEQQMPPKDMVGRVKTISTTFAAISVAVGALAGGFFGNIVPVVDHIFIFHGISYAVIGVFIILVPSVRRLPKINEIGESQE